MALLDEAVILLVQPQNAVVPLLLSIAIYLLLQITYIARDPLKGIPSPSVARYTVLWYVRALLKGDFHYRNIELHEKHGKIVRLAPNLYSMDDVDAAKIIYGHGTKFLKSEWYSSWTSLEAGVGNLFAERDATLHGLARRRFSNFYSMSSMVHYETYVDECIRTFSEKLKAFSRRHEAIDIGTWLQYYAFDVIANITFGAPFGYLERAEDIDNMIAKLDLSNLYSTLAGLFPRFHSFVARVGSNPARIVINYTMRLITERKDRASTEPEVSQNENRTQDFLGKFLTAHRNDPSAFSSIYILNGCLANIFAGSDTTSISLSSIIFYLMQNPQCLTKLREDINFAAANGTVSDPITFAQSQDLPYFQAVIKEAMRLNPAVGLPLFRAVPAGGAVLCGKFFPEGTVVGVNPWVAHRNKLVFGHDADTFRPERWLEGTSPSMASYFMPFGLGSRTCIGKHISLLEIGKLIPQLVRHFDFKLTRPQEELVGKNYWFVKPQEFTVVPVKL